MKISLKLSSKINVHLHGETGVGKTKLAKEIAKAAEAAHENEPRLAVLSRYG